MAKTLKKPARLFRALLDVLLPPVCYVCGKSCSSEYGICYDCMDKVKHNLPPNCPKCARHMAHRETVCGECSSKQHHIEKGWSCCDYAGTIKDCIHLFKYNRYLGLSDIFSDIMAYFAKKNELPKMVDLIVPVPMHPAKKRERTYNHAEILARNLSETLSIPLDSKNLKKIKWTQSQSELDRAKRIKNTKGVFLAVDKNIFSGRNILLVDDVFTTGSTINECAKVLLEANAGKAYFLTLARGGGGNDFS